MGSSREIRKRFNVIAATARAVNVDDIESINQAFTDIREEIELILAIFTKLEA